MMGISVAGLSISRPLVVPVAVRGLVAIAVTVMGIAVAGLSISRPLVVTVAIRGLVAIAVTVVGIAVAGLSISRPLVVPVAVRGLVAIAVTVMGIAVAGLSISRPLVKALGGPVGVRDAAIEVVGDGRSVLVVDLGLPLVVAISVRGVSIRVAVTVGRIASR